MNAAPRVLVLGIGNPDRGDDGVGVLVAQRIADCALPGVEVRIPRGDLLALVDEFSTAPHLICIDAAAALEQPGRVHRLDARDAQLLHAPARTSSHGLGLAEALALARALDCLPAQATVYAIEIECCEPGAAIGAVVLNGADVAEAAVLADIAAIIG